MYNPPYFGSPYCDPPLYGKVLPKPTASGTLEKDVKRPKLDQPSPYYFPQSPYQQPLPAPYYSSTPLPPSSSPAYGCRLFWNQPSCSSNMLHTSMSQPPPVLAPTRDSQPVPMNKSGKDDAQEESDTDEESDGSPKAKPSTSVIQGTSITLATEEDIKQWRLERRKMWLLKISNRRREHMEKMGVKEEDLKGHSVLQEKKKQKQFIQNIQNQVNRTNPKSNLDVKIVQREMAYENLRLFQFIKELGDAHLLEYDLTLDEKSKLFGSSNDRQKSFQKPHVRRNGKP